MKRIHLVFILLIISQFVYSQEYTLKDLKVNGKVKKITHSVYGSNVASDHLDSLYLYNQTIQFFNEMGYLTLDSGITYSGENCQKVVYSYDSLNQLIQIVTYDKRVKDKKFRKSEVKEYKYDQNGNEIFYSYSTNFGGTSIIKSFYNQENKITLWQSYYIDHENKRKKVKPEYSFIEYEPKKIVNKSYNADSTLSYIWIDEFENEKYDRISKTHVYYNTKDSLELFEKHEYFYEDSTKIKIITWRKNTSILSTILENIEYYDTPRRLIKQEHYENGEISIIVDYFYDELGNCIKRATHLMIPMVEIPEFMYDIYKYEFY